MDKKKTIHELRCSLARQRQPEHDASLSLLEELVPASSGHPYKGSNCYSALLRKTEFSGPSKGLQATLPNVKHLFRCISWNHLLKNINLRSELRKRSLAGGDQTVDAGNKVRKELEKATKRGWASLDTIAEDTYVAESTDGSKDRSLTTWWTDLNLRQARMVQDCYRIGMPKTSLSVDCALLRCRIDSDIIAKAKVPTVLDGFASEIFIPTVSAATPGAGQAIDIGSATLKPGEAEFVLGPIEVTRIQIQLLKIPEEQFAASLVDVEEPAFLAKLEAYYRGAFFP